MSDLENLLADGREAAAAIPIHVTDPDRLGDLATALGPIAVSWVAASDFKAKPGTHLTVPDGDGGIAAVIAGLPDAGDPFAPLAAGRLARELPAGTYGFAEAPDRPDLAALGWLFGAYRFDSYRKQGNDREPVRLVLPDGADRQAVLGAARGARLALDLINTPANDLGPAALAQAVVDLASRHGAAAAVTVGDELLEAGFPLIHAVGRASAEAPRLVDFSWGDASHPKVTLVGKGVTFDTGGLDLKPPSAMALMKKDMGGAANVLGLASMIMDARLPVRLRVLVPCVENSVAGASFRPGDILPSRKGLTVEIGNTDAEGRLILADALALADEEAPDLMIDMATLTGAARVALGPDLPPFFVHDDEVAVELARHGVDQADPVWRMPLWPPYDEWVNGQVADISNAPEKPFAGAVTAALFLARFVEQARAHIHLDIYAWSPETRPHALRGGAIYGIRALFALIAARYGA